MLLPYCIPQRTSVKPTIDASMKISVSVCSCRFSRAFSLTIKVSVICWVKYGVIMYIDWHTTVRHSARIYIPRQPFIFFHSHLKRNITFFPFLTCSTQAENVFIFLNKYNRKFVFVNR